MSLIFFLLTASLAPAQLAITEVMSATKENTNTGFRGPEYWELTNFGTNDVDLDGYRFRDSDPGRRLVWEPFTNLVIHPGESIIFFRIADPKDSVTNAAQFRAWWGDAQLPQNLRFRTWVSPGLSAWDGDEVVLMDAFRNVVDSVSFPPAEPGWSFAYGPDSGTFGSLSVNGEDGAFKAALSGDVGSPGTTTGIVSLHFLTEPSSQSADAGMTVIFKAAASGVPRPGFRWFRDGVSIPSGTNSTLIIQNVQVSHSGDYQVRITNGVEERFSRLANLSVNTQPAAAAIAVPPKDSTVFVNQTAAFSVSTRGLPLPQFQWKKDGIDLPGETSSSLLVPASETVQSGTYSVRVWNTLGETNASATLNVVRTPDLRFTEVMAFPSDEEGNRHFDWFELTNYDTNVIDLTGWRFSDQNSFARAFTITNSLVLEPGESAVFAQRLPWPLFENWWGRDNLPSRLKFCGYNGFGLNKAGETLFLWNPPALYPWEFAASVRWNQTTLGVTFEASRECDGIWCEDEAAVLSVAGERGAFRAGNGTDVGSPGYVVNPPVRILSVIHGAGGLIVKCRVIPGRSYRLWRTPSLASEWQPVRTSVAYSNVLEFSDTPPGSGSSCFYRLEEVPLP